MRSNLWKMSFRARIRKNTLLRRETPLDPAFSTFRRGVNRDILERTGSISKRSLLEGYATSPQFLPYLRFVVLAQRLLVSVPRFLLEQGKINVAQRGIRSQRNSTQKDADSPSFSFFLLFLSFFSAFFLAPLFLNVRKYRGARSAVVQPGPFRSSRFCAVLLRSAWFSIGENRALIVPFTLLCTTYAAKMAKQTRVPDASGLGGHDKRENGRERTVLEE